MPEEDEFSLSLEYKGKPLLLEGRLRRSTYTYQLVFDLEETELLVEKDDQGDWRAFAPGVTRGEQAPDPALVKIIMTEVEKQFS